MVLQRGSLRSYSPCSFKDYPVLERNLNKLKELQKQTSTKPQTELLAPLHRIRLFRLEVEGFSYLCRLALSIIDSLRDRLFGLHIEEERHRLQALKSSLESRAVSHQKSLATCDLKEIPAVLEKLGPSAQREAFLTHFCSSAVRGRVQLAHWDRASEIHTMAPKDARVANKLTLSRRDFESTAFRTPQASLKVQIGSRRYLVKGLGTDKVTGRLRASGNYGRVFLGKDVTSKRRVAIKVTRPPKKGELHSLEDVEKEARVLLNFDGKSPYLVTASKVGRLGKMFFFVMTPLEGGDLESLWDSAPKRMIISYLIDAAKGLEALHKEGILHRDIKPENILVHKDKKRAALADLGLCELLPEGVKEMKMVYAGTEGYSAPESDEEELVGKPTDIWSFGATIYSCLERKHPPQAMTTAAINTRNFKRKHGQVISTLLLSCLDQTPGKRPTAKELRESLEVYFHSLRR